MPYRSGDELLEVLEMRTRRVAHHEARGQVDDGRAVLLHLLRRILEVAAGATAARDEAHHLDVLSRVAGEAADPLVQGAEALAAGTAAVPVADDDADLDHVMGLV
jgi:hypothetical protein